MHLAKIASRYFDYAEITEMHQEKKLDAPSGTAVFTAQEMVAARGKPFEHTMPEKEHTARRAAAPSTRASPSTASACRASSRTRRSSFGGLGQTLSLRHDSNGRESFIPGVMLATREVMTKRELVIGLDKLIGL